MARAYDTLDVCRFILQKFKAAQSNSRNINARDYVISESLYLMYNEDFENRVTELMRKNGDDDDIEENINQYKKRIFMTLTPEELLDYIDNSETLGDDTFRLSIDQYDFDQIINM